MDKVKIILLVLILCTPLVLADIRGVVFPSPTTISNGSVTNNYYNITGGNINGSGVTERVAYYNGTSSITSDADFYFDVDNNKLYVTQIGTSTINNAQEIYTDDLVFTGAIYDQAGNFYYDGTDFIVGNDTPIGKFTVVKDNTNYDLTNASDGHFVLNNPNPYAQIMMMFAVDGTVVGGVRGDFQGNFNWHAQGGYQGHQFYDSLDTSVPVMGIGANGVEIFYGAGATATYPLDVNGIIASSSYYMSGGSGGVTDCYDSSLGGQVCSAGGIVYSITDDPSDSKFKKDIKPLQENLSKFYLLEPSEWLWNMPNKKGKGEGFVAQNLSTIYPNLVKQGISKTYNKTIIDKYTTWKTVKVNDVTNKTKVVEVNVTEYVPIYDIENYSTIDYAGIIALQTKKIQELEYRIKALEDKVG